MSSRSPDFARVSLPIAPETYTATWMRGLVGRIENLISTRLSRYEQPMYTGSAYTRVTGTNAAQAIAITTDTVVQFNTLVTGRDDLVAFQPGSFDFLVSPVSDLVLAVQIRTDGTTGTCLVKVRRNGVVAMALNLPVRTGGDLVASFPVHASAGDVFDVVVNVSSAQNLNLTLSSCVLTRISEDPRLRET